MEKSKSKSLKSRQSQALKAWNPANAWKIWVLTLSNDTTIKTLQAESQNDSFLLKKKGDTVIQNKKKNHHAKTFNDRNSKPQQKHRLERSVKFLLGGLNRF